MSKKEYVDVDSLVEKISDDALIKVSGGAVKDNENIEDKKGFKELILALFGKLYNYLCSMGNKNQKEHTTSKSGSNSNDNINGSAFYDNENADSYAPSAPTFEEVYGRAPQDGEL